MSLERNQASEGDLNQEQENTQEINQINAPQEDFELLPVDIFSTISETIEEISCISFIPD